MTRLTDFKNNTKYRSVVSGDLWYAVPLVKTDAVNIILDVVTVPELPRAGDVVEDINDYPWEVIRLLFRNEDGCITAVVKSYV